MENEIIENKNQSQEIVDNEEQIDDVTEYEQPESESGYTTSPTEIAFLQASKKYDVISNDLLGSFDNFGKYTIPENILVELISLKKVIGSKSENGIEALASYKDGITFRFLLKKEEVNKETNIATSVLYVLETINKVNGYIQNIISTPVGTYSYKNDEFYYQNCLQVFHIVKRAEDEDDGALKGPADAIDKRYAYLSAVKANSKDAYLDLEKNYFDKRMQILNSIPQGTIILSEFLKKRALLEKYFLLGKNKYRALNELLTAILESNPELLQEMKSYEILMMSLNSRYLTQCRLISEKIKASEDYKNLMNAHQVFINEIITPKGNVKVGGKKPAPKKANVRSGGGGGKKGGGGGGGKKGDKKKDKKDEKKKPMGSPTKDKPAPIKIEHKKNVIQEITEEDRRKLAQELKVEVKQPNGKYDFHSKAGNSLNETNKEPTLN